MNLNFLSPTYNMYETNKINIKVFNLTQLYNIYYLLILATSFGHHDPSSGQYHKNLKTLKLKMLVYINHNFPVYKGYHLHIILITTQQLMFTMINIICKWDPI